MRRALGVLCVVLVLGAWTCAPPRGGGDDVAGVSTAGLAALIEGEDWHYVGEAGEPAFENSWTQISGGVDTAFRIREAGIVDLAGSVEGGANPSYPFTVPEGYRPSDESPPILGIGRDSATGDETVVRIIPQTNGRIVLAWSSTATVDQVTFQGQYFLNVPGLAP